jgi:hypothetical protein
MANKPITLKIDVKKIAKEHLFQGKTALYLDLVAWPTKESRNGETHYVVQSLSKAAREAGEKGAIVGNLTMPDNEPPHQRQAPKQKTKPPVDPDLDPADEDSIPFMFPFAPFIAGLGAAASLFA